MHNNFDRLSRTTQYPFSGTGNRKLLAVSRSNHSLLQAANAVFSSDKDQPGLTILLSGHYDMTRAQPVTDRLCKFPNKKTAASPGGGGCGIAVDIPGGCGQKNGTFLPVIIPPLCGLFYQQRTPGLLGLSNHVIDSRFDFVVRQLHLPTLRRHCTLALD